MIDSRGTRQFNKKVSIMYEQEKKRPDKLHILIIAQYYPPDIGGASARSHNIARGLSQLGHKVNVISAFPHYPHGNILKKYKGKAFVKEVNENITTWRTWIPALPHNNIPNRMILHLSFIFTSLFLLIKNIKYDVIWSANPNLFSFFPSLLFSFVKNKPIIRNVDDLWPEVFYDLNIVRSETVKKGLNLLAKLSYLLPLAITPVSYAYIREICKKYKININKMHTIEVGVEKMPQKLPVITKDSYIVMYSGVLSTFYDFDMILNCAEIMKEYGDIKFVVRGMGECEKNIRNEIIQRKITNISLCTEYLSNIELSKIMSQADVFLLPMLDMKYSELGLPTKIFEYQSYEKPIICSSKGESRRYIINTNSGLVINNGDYVNLKKAIITLYNNKCKSNELGKNGYEYVKHNLTSLNLGKKMTQIIISVLK